jgi:hypothetical protein
MNDRFPGAQSSPFPHTTCSKRLESMVVLSCSLNSVVLKAVVCSC